MMLHIARDDEVERLWPAVSAARLFATPGDFERFRAAGPWRVLIDEQGRAAVLERWREHLDILGMKGVWCAEKDLASVIDDVGSIAREHSLGRIMSPLIADDMSGPYRAAGMEVHESIVALRADARSLPQVSPEVPEGYRLLLADPGDEDALRLVDEACFPPFWRYGSAAIARMPDEGRVLKATRSEQVIGYTWCTMDRGIGTLGRLAVLPDHRREGVGGAMLSDALGYLARNGADVVSLCTQEDNAASRALYRRVGLRELPGRLVFLVSEV
jgi:ribosomal protein S18 acetylase RimI-like enzyme